MSKENALRFMLLMDKDEELKRNYYNIMVKYEGKQLLEEEWHKVVLEEVIPFAKAAGYDLSLEDLTTLHKPVGKELGDEELDEVVGGRGEDIWYDNGVPTAILSCEFAPDNNTFQTWYYVCNRDCPNYIPTNEPHLLSCMYCANLKTRSLIRGLIIKV